MTRTFDFSTLATANRSLTAFLYAHMPLSFFDVDEKEPEMVPDGTFNDPTLTISVSSVEERWRERLIYHLAHTPECECSGYVSLADCEGDEDGFFWFRFNGYTIEIYE